MAISTVAGPFDHADSDFRESQILFISIPWAVLQGTLDT